MEQLASSQPKGFGKKAIAVFLAVLIALSGLQVGAITKDAWALNVPTKVSSFNNVPGTCAFINRFDWNTADFTLKSGFQLSSFTNSVGTNHITIAYTGGISKGSTFSYSDPFSVRFKNVGAAWDGKAIDLIYKVRKIDINAKSANANISKFHLLAMFNSAGTKINNSIVADSIAQDSSGNFLTTSYSVTQNVDMQIVYAGTNTLVSGRYQFPVLDLDMYGIGGVYGAPGTEQITLGNGFASDTYVLNNTVLKYSSPYTNFQGTQITGSAGTPTEEQGGLVAFTNGGAASFVWSGANCGTTFFGHYYNMPTAASAQFGAKKELANALLNPGAYSFQLKDSTGKVLQTKTNGSMGAVSFDKINYSYPGTYTYTISEVKGADANVTYDETVYDVSVLVTLDTSTNKLSAVATYKNRVTGETTDIGTPPVFKNASSLTYKTADPVSGTAVEAGSEIDYTITYQNTTGADATVTISDTVPAYTTFVSAEAAGGVTPTAPAAGAGGAIEWKDVPVAAGATVTATFKVKVDEKAEGVVVDNIAHITPSNAPEFDTNHTYHPVDPKKSDPTSGTVVEAGSEITYTLTYRNTSDEPTTVTITDATPAFTTFVSATHDPTGAPGVGDVGTIEWKDVPVAAGSTLEVSFTVKVDDDAQGEVVDNVAHISPSNMPTYDTNHTVHPVDPKASVPVTGTAVEAGSDIAYSVTYKNLTGKEAFVTIVDPVPANTVYKEGSANEINGVQGSLATEYLAPGKWYDGMDCVVWEDVPVAADGKAIAEFSATVDKDARGVVVDNVAHIIPSDAPEFDTNHTYHPVDPKASDPVDGTVMQAGDKITYSLVYKNTSDESVTVAITDAVPEFTTFVSATGDPQSKPAAGGTGDVKWNKTVAPDKSVEVTFTVLVTKEAQGKVVDNVAHFKPSNSPAYDTNHIKHPVDPKTANPASGTAVEAGSEITYTLNYKNTTGADATVTITDSVPEFTSYVSATGDPTTVPSGGSDTIEWKDIAVAAGADVSVTFTVKIDDDAQGKVVENTAHITPSNGPAYDTNTTYHPVEPKTANPVSGTVVEAGSIIEYTLTYENTTGEKAKVTISDATPKHTTFVSAESVPGITPSTPTAGSVGIVEWKDISLNAGEAVTVTFKVKVDDDAQGEVVDNVAHIAPSNFPAFDTNHTYHPVDPKTADPSTGTAVEAGSEIEYTLTYQNTTGEAADVEITDSVPEFATFVSATGDPIDPPSAGGTGTLKWAFRDVADKETVTVTFKVKVNEDAQGKIVENIAHIAPSNRPAYDTNKVFHPVDPKTASPSSGTAVEAGSLITYTLTYENTETVPVKVTITDAVPAATTFVSASGNPTTQPASGATGKVEWKDVTVDPEETLTVAFVVKVDDDAKGTIIENVAHIAPENKPEFDTNPVVHPVDPKTSNPVSGTAVEAGSTIEYTLTYKNTTDADAKVTITDEVPAFSTFLSAAGSPTGTPAVGSRGTVEWKDVAVAKGATVSVTFKVKVDDDAQGEIVDNVAHIAPSNRPDFDTNHTVHPVDPKSSTPASGTAVEAGSEITYKLTYKNITGVDAKVTITDATPAATTFVSATGDPKSTPSAGGTGTVVWEDIDVAKDATVEVTFTVRVNDDAKGALINNVAHITPSNAPEFDTNPVKHPVDPKDADPVTGTAVEAGSEIEYTLTYKNTSSENVTVDIADATPAFTTFVSATGNPKSAPKAGEVGIVTWEKLPVKAGETVTVTFKVKVDDDAQGKVVENVAHIAPSNAPEYFTNKVFHPVDPKAADPVSGTAVEAGSDITYTLTYKNTTEEDCTVTVTDMVPAFTTFVSATGDPSTVPTVGTRDTVEWKDVAVEAGAELVVTFTVKVDADAQGKLVENVAHIAPSNSPEYDTNKVFHPVDPKTANPSDGTAVEAGSEITYTLTYKNTTGENATVTVTDATPAATTFVSATGNPTTKPEAGKEGKVEWKDVPVAKDSTLEVTFTVKVNDDAKGTIVENTAHIDPKNRPAFDTNPVEHPVDPKTANPASGTAVEAGSEIEYTLTYKNTTDADAKVTITDDVPEHTTFVSATGNPATAPAKGATGTVEWKDISVAKGATVSVTFKVKVDDDAQGEVVDNVAHIAPSNRPGFDTNHTVHPVDPKSADPATGTAVEAGTEITYTLTYRNATEDDATVTITDATPAATTFVSATGGPKTVPSVGGIGEIVWEDIAVAAGAKVEVTFTVRVDDDAQGALVENTAHFKPSNSPEFDSNPTKHPVDPKTADPVSGTAVEAGSEIEYTLTYKNTSDKNVTVSIADATPQFTTFVSATGNPVRVPEAGKPGIVEWKDLPVEAGKSVSVTFKVKVDDDAQGKVVENVAHIMPSNAPDYDTNTTYHPVDPKTANPADGTAVEAGSDIIYKLTYKNTTGKDCTVTITDEVPEFTTFVSATGSATSVPAAGARGTVEWKDVPVAAGATLEVTFTVHVDDDAKGTVVENTAHIAPSNKPAFETNTTKHPVDPKTSDPADGTAIEAGSEITYTLTYKNTTGEDSTVTITDATPAATTFVSATGSPTTAPNVGATGSVEWKDVPVAAGATVEVTFTVKVDADAQGTVVENTAHITPKNKPAFDTNTIRHPVDPKTADPASGTAVEAGSEIEYKLTYRNTTGEDCTVTVTDEVPAFTTFVSATGNPAEKPAAGERGTVAWKDVPVKAGATLELTFKVKVDDDAQGKLVENVAHIDPSNRPAYDTNTTVHPVGPKAANPASSTAVEAGSEITYTLTYKNTTDEDCTVTVTDSVPEFTTFVSATGSPTTAPNAGATGPVEWKDVPLAAGETLSVTFTVKVDDDAQGSLVENTAHIAPSNKPAFDTNPTNHPVDPKSSDPVSNTAIEAGSEIEYTLTYKNTTGKAVTVTITDATPEFTTFVSAAGNPATTPAEGATGTVEWKDVPVAAGETLTVSFIVLVDDDAQGEVVENVAHITPSNGPDYDTNKTEHPVDPKTSNPANGTAVEAGSDITYTLTYKNVSDKPVKVTITDATPEYTTFVSSTGTPTTEPSVGTTGRIEWKDLEVAAGESISVTFTVHVDDNAQGVLVENTAHIAPSNRPAFDTNPTNHPVDPKTANPASHTAVEAGSEITYTLTYKNTTGENAAVTIKDATPEYTTFVSATGDPTASPAVGATGGIEWKNLIVPDGETVSVTFTVRVDDDAQGQIVENVAHIVPSNRPAFDTNKTEHPVDPKTANPASGTAVEAGSNITYTLTYKNTSAEDCSVTITDAVPAYTTFVSATGNPTSQPASGGVGDIVWADKAVRAGATVSVTFTVRIDADARGTLVRNTAHINPSNAPGFDTNPVYHPVDPKTANPASGTAVEAGSDITYTLTYRNTTDEDCTVTITDATPDFTTYVSATGSPSVEPEVGAAGAIEWTDIPVAAGGTVEVTFTVHVDDDAYGQTVNNVAHIDPSNGPAYDTNPVSHPVDPEDPTGIKTSDPAPGTIVEVFQKITYRLTYQNVIGEDATVTIVDPIPEHTIYSGSSANTINGVTGKFMGKYSAPGTWYDGRDCVVWENVPVASAESVTAEFKVKVLTAGASRDIENTGHMIPSNRPAFDTNKVVHPVSPVVDPKGDPDIGNLEVVKAVDKAEAKPGDIITYTLIATNTGEEALEGIMIRDFIPEYTTYVTCDNDGYHGTIDGKDHVTWIIPFMLPGDVKELTFSVKINADTPEKTTIINVALYGPGTDPSDPNSPTNPSNPVETVTPSNPANPTDPTNPTNPGGGKNGGGTSPKTGDGMMLSLLFTALAAAGVTMLAVRIRLWRRQ